MNKTNIALVGVAVLAVVVGFLAFRPQVLQQITNAPPLGAVSGNEIQGQQIVVGGQSLYLDRVSLTQATTTVCRRQTPNATTTLIAASVKTTGGTTTAVTMWELAKTTNALSYATTTRLAIFSTTFANQLVGLNATNTIVNGLTDNIIAPNSWLVVKFGGAVGGDVSLLAPAGSCEFDLGLL